MFQQRPIELLAPAKNLECGIAAIDPDIKWNFTKFVVDRAGSVVARFEPTAKMADLDACVAKLL